MRTVAAACLCLQIASKASGTWRLTKESQSTQPGSDLVRDAARTYYFLLAVLHQIRGTSLDPVPADHYADSQALEWDTWEGRTASVTATYCTCVRLSLLTPLPQKREAIKVPVHVTLDNKGHA